MVFNIEIAKFIKYHFYNAKYNTGTTLYLKVQLYYRYKNVTRMY